MDGTVGETKYNIKKEVCIVCDLINREDVIKCLQENGWLDDTNLDDLIEAIPTAYDTDKVINELTKESKKLGIGFFPERKYIQEENAIEIVKRGYIKID